MSDFNINEDAQSGCSQSSSHDDPGSQPSDAAFPGEDEDTVTMQEIIDREESLEEEASAVLGNSDEKNCTYPKGYIPRQALYSCATCSDGPDNQAAICLACSLECHDNHEVYELYTKRNYRCDCGNSKFKEDFSCKLMDKEQKKSPTNDKNKYNHNFLGKYCICDKRFPPDENDNSAESNDEMWQCIVCEDWYHTKHLKATTIPNKFDELICGNCVEQLDFVHHYRNIEDNPSATDVKSEKGEVSETKEEICILENLKQKAGDSVDSKSSMFLLDCSWRSKLCRCDKCLEMYKAKDCEYLLDDKDTVQYYEAQGKAIAQNGQSPLERGMSALNRMNRAAVVEALNGYDELKADLSVYLKKFVENKKVVRKEDIDEFFDQLNAKKRAKLDYS